MFLVYDPFREPYWFWFTTRSESHIVSGLRPVQRAILVLVYDPFMERFSPGDRQADTDPVELILSGRPL